MTEALSEVLEPSIDSEKVAGAPVVEARQSDANRWWRVGDALVWLGYIFVTAFTLRYHEKWADEAQAWLLARDLSLKTLWLKELRYEGSPGLWHTILWAAQRGFHAPYNSIGYIGLAFAVAGAGVLLFCAPFPRYVRWPLAFTYVLIYQYAVIARSYTLLPLLVFLAAMFFRSDQPGKLTFVLVLLANTALHGAILAGGFAFAYALRALRVWSSLEWKRRKRVWICAAVMTATFVWLFVVLKPGSDVEEFHTSDPQIKIVQPPAMQKMIAIVSGAFLDFALPSFLAIAVLGYWCHRRRCLALFAVPVISLTVLYTFVHGYSHHHGTVFLASIGALWAAWPAEKEQREFGETDKRCLWCVTVLLLSICAVNIVDASFVIEREYRFPYSGAEDAANYLKQAGAERGKIFGYIFGVSGVQAYFDHNIFANIPTTYTHHGLPAHGERLDVVELRRVSPEYVVSYAVDPESMLQADGPVWQSLGYEMVHFSDGYSLYKRSVAERESYLIFRRVRP